MIRKFFVLLMLLLVTNTVLAQVKKYPPAKVSFNDFKGLVAAVEPHRAEHLIDFDTFLKMSKDPDTIIFDSRSDFRYERIHIKGAHHLSFTDFTQDNLKKVIPDFNTTILIYCNNNFEGNQTDFQSKIAMPSKPIDPVSNQIQVQEKPIMMALNIPTYINLYGYGYRNVYELDELVNVDDPRIEFEGSIVKKQKEGSSTSWANNNSLEDLSYKKAVDYFNNQEFNKTLDVLNEAINNRPEEDSYYILMGRTYEMLNNKATAKDYYDKAIELKTDDVWAYVGRLIVSEDFTQQEYWAKQAIEKFPYKSTAAFILLHSLYVAQAMQEEGSGNIEKALKLLEETKKLNSDYLVRLEKTPENIFQEEVSGAADAKLDKQGLKEIIEKRLAGLKELEQEWTQKYTK